MNNGIKFLTVFLILGGSTLITAYIFVEVSQEDERIASRPQQALNLFYTTSYRLNSLDTTLILREDAQFIHIYYFIDNIRKDEPFIALILPYSGVLRSGDHDWKSEPMSYGSTLIYKQFSCIENICNYHPYEDYYGTPDGNDQYNLLFEINGKIDSRKAGEHSLNVPVSGVIENDIMLFVDKNVTKKGNYSWRTSFDNVTSTPKISVSIPEEATNLNFFPEAHPRFVNLQSSNRTVFEWEIPSQNTVFHIDFSIPTEKVHYQFYNGIAIFLTGVGITFIITGIAEYVKFRISKNTS